MNLKSQNSLDTIQKKQENPQASQQTVFVVEKLGKRHVQVIIGDSPLGIKEASKQTMC